jgi:hypothetical protein
MANKCATCFYHCKCGGMICCNFLFKTGQRRPCPPGDACTVKVRYRERTYSRRTKKETDHG